MGDSGRLLAEEKNQDAQYQHEQKKEDEQRKRCNADFFHSQDSNGEN